MGVPFGKSPWTDDHRYKLLELVKDFVRGKTDGPTLVKNLNEATGVKRTARGIMEELKIRNRIAPGVIPHALISALYQETQKSLKAKVSPPEDKQNHTWLDLSELSKRAQWNHHSLRMAAVNQQIARKSEGNGWLYSLEDALNWCHERKQSVAALSTEPMKETPLPPAFLVNRADPGPAQTTPAESPPQNKTKPSSKRAAKPPATAVRTSNGSETKSTILGSLLALRDKGQIDDEEFELLATKRITSAR